MGGGSWATALSKLLLRNCTAINWYMRRRDRIEEFKQLGHNPAYLTDVTFDTDRIWFSDDINEVCRNSGTLLFATPSPYFKSHLSKIDVDLSGKFIVSAIKGIVPDENQLVSAYMIEHYNVDPRKILVVSGPCHAEEVALDRPCYLTIGCRDKELAAEFSRNIAGKNVHTITSCDVEGIEYASVLKNVYSIGAGIIHGLKKGDNFSSVFVANAIREMERFLQRVVPRERQICDSVYLGDLLVTSYSSFSRNHNFGAIIGKGYSVKAARMEMEQTAEGYYGTRCIHELNAGYGIPMPILEGMYDILYRNLNADKVISSMSERFI